MTNNAGTVIGTVFPMLFLTDIVLQLETYVLETLNENKMAVLKFLKPKKVPMQLGVMLEQEDCPKTPDPVKQKVYRSFVAELQFAASCIR